MKIADATNERGDNHGCDAADIAMQNIPKNIKLSRKYGIQFGW